MGRSKLKTKCLKRKKEKKNLPRWFMKSLSNVIGLWVLSWLLTQVSYQSISSFQPKKKKMKQTKQRKSKAYQPLIGLWYSTINSLLLSFLLFLPPTTYTLGAWQVRSIMVLWTLITLDQEALSFLIKALCYIQLNQTKKFYSTNSLTWCPLKEKALQNFNKIVWLASQ